MHNIVGILLLAVIFFMIIDRRKLKRSFTLGEEERVNLGSGDYEDLKVISDDYMKLISNFTFSTEALYLEMKDVLCKIEGLSANAEEQSASVSAIENFVESVNQTVLSFAQHASEMSEISSQAHKTVHENQLKITKTVAMYEILYKQLQVSAEKIEGLEEKTKKADTLIASIDRLSDQTNLLALNASIEAARAGDAGRGFAVVANEVKKLSGETSNVVKSSTELLKEIIRLADETRASMNDTVSAIHAQSDRLNMTVNELVKVESVTDSMSVANAKLSAGIGKLVDSFSDILDMLKDMTLAVEDVAMTATDVNQSVDYETQMVNQLTSALDALGETNLKFGLKVDGLSSEQREKNVVVATSPYEPYVIYDSKTGEIGGIDIELIRSVYEGSDYTVDIRIVPWEMSLKMIMKGVADLLPTISYNKDRERYLEFSNQYRSTSTFAFYTLASKAYKIETLKDLERKRVAVLEGYSYFSSFDNKTEIVKDYNVKEEIMFRKLGKGQVDVVIMNELSGDHWLKMHEMNNGVKKEKYKHMKADDAETMMGFSKAIDTKKKLELFNRRLKELSDSGVLHKIEKKYML